MVEYDRSSIGHPVTAEIDIVVVQGGHDLDVIGDEFGHDDDRGLCAGEHHAPPPNASDAITAARTGDTP
jgi:hypothetical protein